MHRILRLFQVFVMWTVIGMLSKIAFLLFHRSITGVTAFSDWCDVVFHGMALDIAIAGYLTLIPALLLVFSIWYRGNVLQKVWKGYFLLTALVCSVAYCVNIILYSYWGFPLDSTPLLYLKTSPADAMASITLLQAMLAVLAILLVAALIALPFLRMGLFPQHGGQRLKRFLETPLMLLLTTLLIIPIRGGIGTGTNHTGTVYYSGNMRLNHAAVNPIFCFVESVTHMEDIAGRYRFMDDEEAERLFRPMLYGEQRTVADSLLKKRERVNVVVVILESFSRYIMSDAGHVKGVTPNLDKLWREGVAFTNFYANSFRTDRALVSILSGLPAQPTMSIMDMPGKSNSLPSIAQTLRSGGYATTLYYGGDADYSNMRSYFMGTGFESVVSEDDFPAKDRTGKWGVADGPLFMRAASDLAASTAPSLKVILTGSSHEPFDVPDHNVLPQPELNAFHYTDACLGEFVNTLQRSRQWENTLVVILPDHLGAYPADIDNYAIWRYHLPLILTGGVVNGGKEVPTVGCQTDLPATLLAMLGFRHDNFLFSRDILDPKAPHFAFFTLDDGMGMVTSTASVVYDNHAKRVITSHGNSADSLALRSKAYLQKLYDHIDRDL